MQPKIATFLMFDGKAEEAMDFYTSIFEDSSIMKIERYGVGDDGAEGTVKVATFRLNGQILMCIDSPIKHPFTFTPAISFFVHCDSEREIDELFEQLSAGGEVLMPLDAYPFSKKFVWLNDRYGVSWQLNFDGTSGSRQTRSA
jgi:predicted 3-demethylubiquinone-9 3-methyltransferase (glyoxalase superfamily)